MQNLNDLLTRLHNAGVEFVLVGGFAAVVHGTKQITQDLDVCVQFNKGNLQRIHGAVADLHPVHRMRPDLPFVLTPDLFSSLKNLYLKTDWGSLDFLGEIKGVGDFAEVAKHTISVELPFGDCRVLDLETLIRAKLAMNRERDIATVRLLRALKEGKG